MTGLIIKDLYINRGGLIGFLIGLLSALIMPLGFSFLVSGFSGDVFIRDNLIFVELVFFALVFLIASTTQQNIFAPDERKRWAYYIVTTPTLAKGAVASKYCFSLLISLTALLMCYIEKLLILIIYGFSLDTAIIPLILLLAQLMMRAIEFPFIIRFTTKHGNTYRSFIFFILFFIGLVYLLFGDLSVFSNHEAIIAKLVPLLDSLNSTLVLLACVILLPIVSVAMYYLSYRISCLLYIRGSEEYDK